MPTADGYTQCGQCGTVGRAHPQGKVLCAWGEAFTSSRRARVLSEPFWRRGVRLEARAPSNPEGGQRTLPETPMLRLSFRNKPFRKTSPPSRTERTGLHRGPGFSNGWKGLLHFSNFILQKPPQEGRSPRGKLQPSLCTVGAPSPGDTRQDSSECLKPRRSRSPRTAGPSCASSL